MMKKTEVSMPTFSDDPFSYIIIAILAIGALYVLYYQIQVRTRGIETYATVTSIVEHESAYLDTVVKRTYDVHIVYRNQANETVEAVLSNPNGAFTVGQRIRIRYVAKHPELPVCVDKEI
jgi:hypothetical protein